MRKIFIFKLMLMILLSLMFDNAVIAKDQKHFKQNIDRLKSDSASDRQRAVLDLFNLLDPSSFEPIAQGLGDPDPYIRYTAAWALSPRHAVFIDKPETNYTEGVFPLTLLQSTKIMAALLNAFPEEDPWARREMLATLRGHQEYQLAQGASLDSKAKQVFLNYMKDPDPNIREEAARGLSKWKEDREAEAAFRQALMDQAWTVRREAVIYFGKDIQVLTEAIKDNYLMVRVAAVYALYDNHRNNPLAVDLLITRLSDTNIDVRIAARSVLGNLKEKRMLKPLLALQDKYKNDSIDVFIESLTSKRFEEVKAEYQEEMKKFQLQIAPIKEPDIQHQIQSLNNGDRFERITALLYLYWVPLTELTEIFQKGIRQNDPLVKYYYLEKLQVYRENMVVPVEQIEPIYDNLLQAAKNPNPHVRRAAIKMLVGLFIRSDKYKARTVDFVKEIVEGARDPFLRHAAIALIDRKSRTSVTGIGPTFLKLMSDEFPEIRKEAVLSISLRCHPEAINSMLKALEDPYAEIRGHAAKELGLSEIIPDTDFIKVQSALKITSENDSSQTVRKWAKQSFDSNQRYLKDKKTVPRPPISCWSDPLKKNVTKSSEI